MAHKRIVSIIVCLCLSLRVMHVCAVEKSEQMEDFKKDAYLHYVRGLILEKEGKDEEALQEHKILSSKQMQEIKALEVF